MCNASRVPREGFGPGTPRVRTDALNRSATSGQQAKKRTVTNLLLAPNIKEIHFDEKGENFCLSFWKEKEPFC
nr:unnamed protein product [Spirometra erinaceieuropaei]